MKGKLELWGFPLFYTIRSSSVRRTATFKQFHILDQESRPPTMVANKR